LKWGATNLKVLSRRNVIIAGSPGEDGDEMVLGGNERHRVDDVPNDDLGSSSDGIDGIE